MTRTPKKKSTDLFAPGSKGFAPRADEKGHEVIGMQKQEPTEVEILRALVAVQDDMLRLARFETIKEQIANGTYKGPAVEQVAERMEKHFRDYVLIVGFQGALEIVQSIFPEFIISVSPLFRK